MLENCSRADSRFSAISCARTSGSGNKMVEGISVPGSTERTFNTYFYSGNISLEEKLHFALDTYDTGGYASGTYYLRELKIQEED